MFVGMLVGVVLRIIMVLSNLFMLGSELRPSAQRVSIVTVGGISLGLDLYPQLRLN